MLPGQNSRRQCKCNTTYGNSIGVLFYALYYGLVIVVTYKHTFVKVQGQKTTI
jgi:hypothetical protein